MTLEYQKEWLQSGLCGANEGARSRGTYSHVCKWLRFFSEPKPFRFLDDSVFREKACPSRAECERAYGRYAVEQTRNTRNPSKSHCIASPCLLGKSGKDEIFFANRIRSRWSWQLQRNGMWSAGNHTIIHWFRSTSSPFKALLTHTINAHANGLCCADCEVDHHWWGAPSAWRTRACHWSHRCAYCSSSRKHTKVSEKILVAAR